MKNTRIQGLVIVCILLSSLFAADAVYGEVSLVRTRLSAGITVERLISKNIDILAAYPDGKVDLAVDEEQLSWLQASGPRVDVLQRPALGAAQALDGNLGAYHTFDEMMSDLVAMTQDHPGLAVLDTIGTSWEGRPIVAIKISDNATVDEEEPEVFIAGCHHARELMSVEVPLMLAQYLLGGYSGGGEIAALVDGLEIWIAPMINPDGHVYVQNNHADDWWTWWRKNRRDNGDGTFGVDLNRNYGFMWGYDDAGSSPSSESVVYRGPAPFSEPETQAVRDFCNGRSFSVALSYHSYSELIIYPWGYDAIYSEDHEFFSVFSDSLARGNGYVAGCTASDILYPVNGGSDDWMYGDTSMRDEIFSCTIELNSYEEGGFAPPDTLIQPTFDKVLGLNLTLLRRAHDPVSVLGPEPPKALAVTDLADPYHMVTWSAGSPSDPNPPIGWEVVEYRDFVSAADPGSPDGEVWEFNGFTLSTARSWDTGESYWSGSGDGLENKMVLVDPWPVEVLGAVFSCRLWFDIESGWDYAYLEVSMDRGLTWSTVPGSVTTDTDPNGNNRGNGITGYSGGWVEGAFQLDQVTGVTPESTIALRFVYRTDAYVTEEGIYLDAIAAAPGYAARTVIAPAHPDTFLVIEPQTAGSYAYLVRGFDSEGHYGRPCDLAFHEVSDITGDETPALTSRLSGSHPNPFNPSTTILFTVGGRGARPGGRIPVELSVFDVSGRLVAVPLEEPMAAGDHSFTWDGRSSRGAPLASGVYFVRLRIGGSIFPHKIVLMR